MVYEFRGQTRAKTEAASGSRRRQRPGREESPKVDREPRQPIHGFAGLMGLVFLLAGIAGFIPGVTSNYDELELSGPESGAKLLGLFQVSVLHNIVHLLFAVGLIAAARFAWARVYLLGGGAAYLGVALYGILVEHGSDANFLPLNDADTVLHVVLALTMIVMGIVGTRLWRQRVRSAT